MNAYQVWVLVWGLTCTMVGYTVGRVEMPKPTAAEEHIEQHQCQDQRQH